MSSGAAYIYHGFWINWSHGRVLGSTITLSSRDGSFLTAFLALFVAVAGSQLWRILSFIVHQARASRDSRDGLHHQQQAILRNTGSAIGAAYEFSRLITPWWKHTRHSFWRSFPLVLLALTNLTFFGAAGILSAEVTKAAGNETLIMSPNCGFWHSGDVTAGNTAGFQAKVLNDTITASNYARACYGNTGNVLQCNSYTKQQIPWKVNVNATCPFELGTCIGTNTAAYEMDTGPIDSHEMLGINAPQKNRVTYRKVTTCAPIHTSGFAQLENYTAAEGLGLPGDQIEKLYYGPLADVSNFTFFYNTHAEIDNFGYNLQSIQWLGGPDSSEDFWSPISALNRTDADITLLFLSQNSISSPKPCDDPMFSAHQTTNDSSTFTSYRHDHFINVLGCIDRHQYCNPNALDQDYACTALTSSGTAGHSIQNLSANAAQILTAGRLAVQLSSLTIQGSVNGRDASALRASETVYDKSQAPLPNNQWQIESSSWFATSLAKLQRIAVEYATGPDFLPEGTSVQAPTDELSRAMCRSQKVRDTGSNTSFSVLGVAVIIALGGLLILTNMILEPIVGWIQGRSKNPNQHRRLQWILDEKLQLQRVAYEEAGIGLWQGPMDLVPVTARGEAFGLTTGNDGKIVDQNTAGLHAKSESSSGKFENDGLLEKEEEKGMRNQQRAVDIEENHPHAL
ncbi:MAG: hypothetical protein M1812_005287 [Candelaria pacifica]|nr:MAG: hypothetical protein M1812_005287 [Candelaria pacifica]